MLLDVHAQVAEELLEITDVAQVPTAFMEYTEPSIASQLRAFDVAGVTEVLAVPLPPPSATTVSTTSTIAGQSSDRLSWPNSTPRELRSFGHRRRCAAPLATGFLGWFAPTWERARPQNAGTQRRAGNRGLALVGYGSAESTGQLKRLLRANPAPRHTGYLDPVDHPFRADTWWSNPRQPTVDAINQMLEQADQAPAVPQLAGDDPMFQERIIQRAVKQSADLSRAPYSADAILPNPRWGIGDPDLAGDAGRTPIR